MFRPSLKPCGQCGSVIEMMAHQKYCGFCLERECATCARVFRVRQVTATGRFCSHACYAKSLVGSEPHNKGTARLPEFSCRRCGLTFTNGRYGRGIFCSRHCSRISQRGSAHYNWQGGASARGAESLEYRTWRKAVFARDGFRCLICWSRGEAHGEKLHAHHIETVVMAPAKILDPENGATLCVRHHRKEVHAYAPSLRAGLMPQLYAPYLRFLIAARTT